MTFARVGATVLAGSLCLFVAGCCCGGGAGRHSSGPVHRERVAERGPEGDPSVSRDEHESARQRILADSGSIARR